MEDPATKSLVLGVLDGHGECGDSVAQFIKRELEVRLFQHPAFGTNIRCAIEETVALVEEQLLQGTHGWHTHTIQTLKSTVDPSIDTDFSGTTMVVAVVRDNRLTVANVGDSRLTLVLIHSWLYRLAHTHPWVVTAGNEVRQVQGRAGYGRSQTGFAKREGTHRSHRWQGVCSGV
jgi:serine/threonine protein phosphatase PrpC